MKKEINEGARNTRVAYTSAMKFFAKCIALDAVIVLGSAIVETITDEKGGEKTTEK